MKKPVTAGLALVKWALLLTPVPAETTRGSAGGNRVLFSALVCRGAQQRKTGDFTFFKAGILICLLSLHLNCDLS
ncbi:hypothetical protein D3C87_1736280 [compost metagenome]